MYISAFQEVLEYLLKNHLNLQYYSGYKDSPDPPYLHP